jgi:hypothetical protein
VEIQTFIGRRNKIILLATVTHFFEKKSTPFVRQFCGSDVLRAPPRFAIPHPLRLDVDEVGVDAETSSSNSESLSQSVPQLVAVTAGAEQDADEEAADGILLFSLRHADC